MFKNILIFSCALVSCSYADIATLATVVQQTSPNTYESIQDITIAGQFDYQTGGITITWKDDYSVNSETILVTLENKNANTSGVFFKYEIRDGANDSYIIKVYKITLTGSPAEWSETEASSSDVIVHVRMYGLLT